MDNRKFELYSHLSNILHWAEIITPKIHLYIEPRQHYCDRGRYLVKAHTINWQPGDDIIDDQDGFPRYYFNFDCMLIEIEDFLTAKKIDGTHKIKLMDQNKLGVKHEDIK